MAGEMVERIIRRYRKIEKTLLQNPQGVAPVKLAETLGVTDKILKRYMDSISLVLPIYQDERKRYRLLPSYIDVLSSRYRFFIGLGAEGWESLGWRTGSRKHGQGRLISRRRDAESTDGRIVRCQSRNE